jgi:hypothetical protein
MMLKTTIVFLFSSIIIISCKNKEQDKKQYYPVYAFIEQELKVLDSMPLAIFKVHEENNKIDTSIIEKKEFRKIVEGLMLNELSSAGALNDYEEMVLEDASIGDITISYTTDVENKSIPKIEIHINPATSKIKSLYAERIEKIDGTKITRKILWTAGKSMMVASTYNAEGTKSTDVTNRFIWNETN